MVLATGGRNFTDHFLLSEWLDRIQYEADDRALLLAVLQGGAGGTDLMVREWAMDRNVWLLTERAKWEDLSCPDARIKTRGDGSRYDANAGPRRNQLMLDKYEVDLCLAMPGGNGTADMVRRCRKAGVPILPTGCISG